MSEISESAWHTEVHTHNQRELIEAEQRGARKVLEVLPHYVTDGSFQPHDDYWSAVNDCERAIEALLDSEYPNRDRPPSDGEDKISDLERAVVEAAIHNSQNNYNQKGDQDEAVETLLTARKPKTRTEYIWTLPNFDCLSKSVICLSDKDTKPDDRDGWALVAQREVEVSDD